MLCVAIIWVYSTLFEISPTIGLPYKVLAQNKLVAPLDIITAIDHHTLYASSKRLS